MPHTSEVSIHDHHRRNRSCITTRLDSVERSHKATIEWFDESWRHVLEIGIEDTCDESVIHATAVVDPFGDFPHASVGLIYWAHHKEVWRTSVFPTRVSYLQSALLTV